MVSRSKRPLKAFRLADPRHALFDGTGAYLHGGRWNSPGRRVIYAAETYAGALLEALVHLNFDEVPDNYSWIEISAGEPRVIEEIGGGAISAWNTDDLTSTRRFGDRWYDERRTAVLLVPSVVTAGVERNVLINSEHPGFAGIRSNAVQRVRWDERLFRHQG